MREHHIRIARTARYYTLGSAGAATREVWIVCHGYAQLARYFLRAFEPLNDGSRLVVAPEALNRYYFELAPGRHAADARVAATWMTREDRDAEIGDYVAYLDSVTAEVLSTAPAATVTALGFSQGAATVSRWAALGASTIRHVVLWGSSLPPELVPAPGLFRGASLTLVLGAADEHVSEARAAREAERLRAGMNAEDGTQFDVVRYDGGHAVTADGLERLSAVLARKRA